MSTSNTIGGTNGHGGRPGRLVPAERPDRLSEASGPMAGRGTEITGVTTGQGRREPAVAGPRSRFLRRYVWWILLVTIVALGGAKWILHSQTRMYKSQASVVVQPPGTQTSTLQAPDMATEKGVVSSGVVLTNAARTLHLQPSDLYNGLSVTSPGSTYLLTIAYSSPNRYTAQQRAEAIAEAYVAYRTPKPVPQSKGRKTTTPTVITTPTATLITSASLPESPSSPKPALDYGIALLLGLTLGIGTAAIADRVDDRLRGPADLAARTGAPPLALIPAFWANRRNPAGRLVMISSPESAIADAYRDLRTRIVQAAATPGARTLIVTSPAREDKDAVAANLAVALAQSGRSTALVCADLRWGQVHELFGAANTKGLTGLVNRRTDLAGALIPTGVPGLQVLPSGPPPLDTGAVLQRPAFRAVVGELRSQADFVVMDAPPVLASADTRLLADLSDMIMLVTDAHRSKRVQVQAAMRELAEFRGRLVGCVLLSVGMRRLLPRSWTPGPIGDSNPADASSWRGHIRAFLRVGKGSRRAGNLAAPHGNVAHNGDDRSGRVTTREDGQ